jgi:hypothetical protein
MFESLFDPTGYKRFRREYDPEEALITPDAWEKFETSRNRFLTHHSVFFADEWLSVVKRGLYYITKWFYGRRPAFHSLSRIINVVKLEGWLYLHLRSFHGGEQKAAADWVTSFYHVQVGAIESQEFRTVPIPHWRFCFSDTIKGPIHRMFFA